MPYSDQVDAEPGRQHIKELLAGGIITPRYVKRFLSGEFDRERRTGS